MDSSLRFVFVFVIAALIGACTHSPPRMPQSTPANYNPAHVRLIKMAAENGLFFQISDAVIRDVPSRSAGDQCRRMGEAPWIDQLYATLEVFEKEPRLLSKVHIVEFRRGDKSKAEISKDLDGAVTLVISYAKTETRQRIESLSDIPCSNSNLDMMGKDVVATAFEWPTPAQIAAPMQSLEDRPPVERLNVDRRFLVWLGERLTLFRLTPELAFEKTPNGKSLLPEAFRQWASEVGGGANTDALDYWLREISLKSKLGAGVKFFALKRDNEMSTGIAVDSVGKFARKMSGSADPTAPYLSYKLESGSFVIAGLRELAPCLNELMSTYRSPLSSMTNYELNPESFLFPGHSCPAANP